MKIIIHGKQSSGKTTIIEALKVCGFVVSHEKADGPEVVTATVEIPEHRGDFFSNLFKPMVRSRRDKP